jgi:hypothetical protein
LDLVLHVLLLLVVVVVLLLVVVDVVVVVVVVLVLVLCLALQAFDGIRSIWSVAHRRVCGRQARYSLHVVAFPPWGYAS